MPRLSRSVPGGLCVHVVTRGNARATVFHNQGDYANLTQLMKDAQERVRLEILAWCLMPNHLHLVLRPREDGDLTRWMHWLLTSHVQRHRIRHGTTGHVWQGRYKSFAIQTNVHLLTVLRYVERNPVRAGLVDSAGNWTWSSTRERQLPQERREMLDPSPVELPQPWVQWVDTPLTVSELEAIRTSVRRNRPFGDAAWTRGLAERLQLLGTLTPRGRPRVL